MDDEATRLDLILKAIREKESSRKGESIITFLDGLHPLIKIAAPVFGAFLWFQGNFATVRMYQDQDVKLLAMDVRFEKQYSEVKALIDQRYRESIAHSDDNRDRTLALLAEIKDSLKTLFLDRQLKH